MKLIQLVAAVSLCLLGTGIAAQAQSVTLVEPAEGATIWGQVINVRWVSEGINIQPADGHQVPGVGHYHLFLINQRDATLTLKPGEPIGKSDTIIHTTEQAYRFENVKPGPYTLYVVVADGLHIPGDPPIMDVIHINVVPVETGQGLQEMPWWLIALIASGIVLAAYFLTRSQ